MITRKTFRTVDIGGALLDMGKQKTIKARLQVTAKHSSRRWWTSLFRHPVLQGLSQYECLNSGRSTLHFAWRNWSLLGHCTSTSISFVWRKSTLCVIALWVESLDNEWFYCFRKQRRVCDGVLQVEDVVGACCKLLLQACISCMSRSHLRIWSIAIRYWKLAGCVSVSIVSANQPSLWGDILQETCQSVLRWPSHRRFLR